LTNAIRKSYLIVALVGGFICAAMDAARGDQPRPTEPSVLEDRPSQKQAGPQEPSACKLAGGVDLPKEQQAGVQGPTQCEPGSTLYKCCGCSKGSQKVIECYCGSDGKPICGGPCRAIIPRCGWKGCFK
jgi:hypothetical protein